MDPNTILIIMKGIELVGTLAPIALSSALKIKQLLDTPDTDYSVEVKVIRDGALASVDETQAMIDAWKAAHGVV